MKRKSHRSLQVVGGRIDLRALEDTPPWEWPPDAGKVLLRALSDRQTPESDRLIAAGLAGDLIVMNEAMADAAIGVLTSTDESEQLRAAAAISLGPVLEQADLFGFEDDLEDVPITEETFYRIQNVLQKVFRDESVPKLARRRILEAAVRSPQDWHREAIAQAHSSGDRDWVLTAVFAMRYVRGFDDQIMEALNSDDPDIHFEAVCAAGSCEIDAAWDHVAALVEALDTPKPLRIAAIEAIGSIRQEEARGILIELTEDEDEDISEAAEETLSMMPPEGFEEDEDEVGPGDWIH